MRALFLAMPFVLLGCAVETSTQARVDDTDVTITTFQDGEDDPNFGLRLGDDQAFSFTLIAD